MTVKIRHPGSAMASKGTEIWARIYVTLGKLDCFVIPKLRYNTHLFKVNQ